jgi:hypothetical protein
VRRSRARKSPVRRSRARKSPVRRSRARKSPVRRSRARKSPVRRSRARKSPVRRSRARKSVRRSRGRKSPVRRSRARKSVRRSRARKSPVRRSRRAKFSAYGGAYKKIPGEWEGKFRATPDDDDVYEPVTELVWTVQAPDFLKTQKKKDLETIGLMAQIIYNKYSILILTEPGYKLPDKDERVNDLISDCPDLKTNASRKTVKTSLVDDLAVFNLGPKSDGGPPVFTVADMVVRAGGKSSRRMSQTARDRPVSVFAMMRNSETTPVRQQDSRDLARREEEIERAEELSRVEEDRVRGQLLGSVQESVRRPPSGETRTVRRFGSTEADTSRMMDEMSEVRRQGLETQQMLLSMMSEMSLRGTSTQMDGETLGATADTRQNRQLREDVSRLVNMGVEGQQIENVRWRDLPTWFRAQAQVGLGRVAMGGVKLALLPGKTLLKVTVFRPMYLAWRRYVQIADYFLEVIGHVWWIIMIGGVIVCINSDDPGFIKSAWEYSYPLIEPATNWAKKGIVWFVGEASANFEPLRKIIVYYLYYLISIVRQAIATLLSYALYNSTSGMFGEKPPDAPEHPGNITLSNFTASNNNTGNFTRDSRNLTTDDYPVMHDIRDYIEDYKGPKTDQYGRLQ